MANTKKYVSLDKLSVYDEKIKKYLADADAVALQSAKDYADGLAGNYDAAGSAATVQGKLDTEIARAKAAEEANAAAAKQAQDEVDALELVVKNIQENAYDDTEVRGLIAGLSTNKADKTQVATDIADAVKVETDARVAAVAGVQGAVDTLSGTHATDKAALEAAIALKADQTALDAVSGVANAAATKVALEAEIKTRGEEITRVEGLVTAEAQRAAGVEADFESRIAEMEQFWEAADDPEGTIDKLAEIVNYIASDKTGALDMAGDIAENAKAISDMDTAYKAADTTLQGNIDTLAGVVATKAAQSDLTALDGRVGTLETTSATHATKDELNAVSGALNEYKEAHKSDYTNAQIDAAIKVNTDAISKLNDTYATDAELTAAIEAEVTRANGAYAAKSLETTVSNLSATVDTKAAQSEVNTISGKVGTLEGQMTQAQTDIDAVEAKAAANETAIGTLNTTVAGKADTTALNGVSDRVTAIETWHENFVEVSEEEINNLFKAPQA